MLSYTFILVFLCEVTANNNYDYYNFGTILFSSEDARKRWSMHDTMLLRARRQLIDLVPPPQVLNVQDENLPGLFLNYFKNCFATIKGSTDPETEKVLETALSDIIGAYMKKWVLPIVKYSYYGGTAPQDDALELFALHERIKKSLNTDGKGWHGPNFSFLNSLEINVVPIKEKQRSYSRSISNGCEGLAYFENTSSGFIIPVPSVNWDSDSEVMFVPLKNNTLISLRSPTASDSIINYYLTAKNCIESSNIEKEQHFDERLQQWLMDDIVPHLNDEKIYPALRNVLALVNKTNNLGDTVMDLDTLKRSNYLQKTYIGGLTSVDLSSKKMMVITIIIILELVWCIPTLCYLMCAKIRKRRKNNDNNVYFLIEPKRRAPKLSTDGTQFSVVSDNTIARATASRNVNSKGTVAKHSTKSACLGVTLNTKSNDIDPTYMALNINENTIGTWMRSNVSSQLSGKYIVPIQDQGTTRTPPKKISRTSSIKDLFVDKHTNKEHSLVNLNNELSIEEQEAVSKTGSFITVQDLQSSKIIKIPNENTTKSKESGVNVDVINESSQVKRDVNRMLIDKELLKPVSTSSSKKKQNEGQPHKNSKILMKDSIRANNRKQNTTHTRAEDRLKTNRIKREPRLGITIDNRNTDILCSVNVRGPKSTHKPSKIPKRFITTGNMQCISIAKKEIIGHKSYIPQYKRKVSIDDLAVTNTSKKSSKKSDLNVTL